MPIFNKPHADIWIRGDHSLDEALARSTHLAIGAHQDDLEIMAYHGIAACYDSVSNWFSGVVVTDGRGSSRSGEYANFDDDAMRQRRRSEQVQAAEVGLYSSQIQLDYASSEVKGEARGFVVEDLLALLNKSKLDTLYLHQPADKHDSHVAVLSCCVDALRRLDLSRHPRRILGCEVWRGLDWLPDSEKVALDCSSHPKLALKLLQVFDSQISGGKRYDQATIGRRQANATYFDAHHSDAMKAVTWAIDLKPLISEPAMNLADFIDRKIDLLKDDVRQRVGKYS